MFTSALEPLSLWISMSVTQATLSLSPSLFTTILSHCVIHHFLQSALSAVSMSLTQAVHLTQTAFLRPAWLWHHRWSNSHYPLHCTSEWPLHESWPFDQPEEQQPGSRWSQHECSSSLLSMHIPPISLGSISPLWINVWCQHLTEHLLRIKKSAGGQTHRYTQCRCRCQCAHAPIPGHPCRQGRKYTSVHCFKRLWVSRKAVYKM